jgi:hypothetical protein
MSLFEKGLYIRANVIRLFWVSDRTFISMTAMTISEESIAEALTRCRGDIASAARLLKLPVTKLTVRVNHSENLTNIKRAFRSFLFDELSDFTVSAVRDGVVRQFAIDDWGRIITDSAGNDQFIYIAVDPTTRLAAAGKLLTILKSEAGISDRTDHTLRTDGSEDIKAIAAALRLGAPKPEQE